jgi:hypothetical protein
MIGGGTPRVLAAGDDEVMGVGKLADVVVSPSSLVRCLFSL